MARKYGEVRSAFIRREIRRARWEERQRIDELLQLDALIDAPHPGWIGSVARRHLEEKYPLEYLRLLRERGIERLRAGIAELREQRALRREREVEAGSKEKAARDEWEAAGAARESTE